MPEYVRRREQKVLIERDGYGRERKVIAARGISQQAGHWDIELVHPNGECWKDRINAGHSVVVVKMETC